MASKSLASIALLLSLNILFFNMVSSTYVPCPPPPPKDCHKCHSNNNKPPATKATCPRDALKLGVCANVLKSLLKIQLGTPPTLPCCSLLDGLVDLEAAACLCTALKANVLGIKLNVPISLSLLINNCGRKVPTGFECA